MEPSKDIDAWADALLDQHRTMPREEIRRMNEPAPLEDLPPIVRLSMRFGGNHPTREQAERMKRAVERHQRFENVEAVVGLVGTGLLVAFIFVAYSGF